MSAILQKARELGEEISRSAELQEMLAAQQAMLGSPEAAALIEEFNRKQKYYMTIQRQGLELTDSQKQDIADLEERMLDNELVLGFFRAQQNFEKILEEINNIISQAISGQAACSADSCSDECCSSCSGCGV
ncbi:MAG: YlbF family regulator [Desulfurispora sp.]|uniref:YlbF family regulator n=1 Tax=Desulfurispora sp. TaxID=3014275 RepID=UPI0040498A5E